MTIFVAWLFADFISGLVHWWEDRAIIGVSRFRFIEIIREDNDRHHKMPGYLLKLSWWGNLNTTAPYAWIVAAILFIANAPIFFVYVMLFLSVANLVHRWSHEAKEKLPSIVVVLQRTGILISRSHHNGHHYVAGRPVARQDSKIRYCVMSNWLNPILDNIKFFKFLEWIVRV